MALTYLVPIDLGGNEIQNVRVHILAADPGSPTSGQIWFNSTGNVLKYYDGTTVQTVGSSSYGDEDARDAIGAALVAGANINIVVDDPNDTITLSVTGLDSGDLSDFATAVKTQVGTMVTGNTETNIVVTYEAGDGTLDFVVANASDTVSGVVELATTSEATTGTDTTRAITAAGLAARTPPASDTVSGLVELATTTEATTGTDTTRAVTAAGVAAAIAALVDAAPGTLDTLNELAAALGDDPNFATTMTNSLATKTETYAVDIGDNAATSFVVTHNFGTSDVDVSVRRTTTPWDYVMTDMEATSTNTVTIRFATAPTLNQYRAIVVG